MGFIDALKNLKNKFVNAFDISTKYNPYFNKAHSNLLKLELMDESIDPSITNIYNQLKANNPDKYQIQIKDYELLPTKIRVHNENVNKIESAIDGFDYYGILDNPHSFKYSSLTQYDDILRLIDSFSQLNQRTEQFVTRVKGLKENYFDLLKEFDLFSKYNDLKEFDENHGYIDSNEKRQYLSTLNDIKAQADKLPISFYEWEDGPSPETIVKQHNRNFVERNMSNHLFDDINGRSLDPEQRRSVLIDELSTLVVAGAGSGKTLTICGKVKYLIEEKNVKPEDILLLSYSSDSAADLQQKVSKINPNLTVGTFHKIGLDILKETLHKTFMVETQYKNIIEEYFSEKMRDRPHMLDKIITYYSLYLYPSKKKTKYKDEGELYEELKKSDYDTLKNQLVELSNDPNKKETIKKEYVKSYEEMAIANWYFINGIKYTYEAPYEYDVSTLDKRQYTPDFKLRDYKIYHEHYGVDKNGNANQYSGAEAKKYVEGMLWKRQLHAANKTICIETYSYEFEDGTIFEKLGNELKKRGVVFKPLSSQQISNALNSIYESKQFKSFINLIRTFLSLYKSTYRTANEFENLKNYSFKNSYEKKRAILFLDIVKDIYTYYMDYLKAEDKIDFDDMILESITQLDNTKKFSYKYIIVDEFQDISVSRMLFLKRLIEQGNSKLFAVGDDWQAIYRFSGCDLNIFLEFSKYFGVSEITSITSTHRNSQELQDIAGPFIKKNPEQYNKVIKSDKNLSNPVQIAYYTDKKYSAFLQILKHISKIKENASVLVLGRNNKDIDDIALDSRIYIDRHVGDETKRIIKCNYYPKMKITYSTVHASKGLEDEFVIIINADDHRIGFPNKLEDDSLLDLVLSHKSEFEYAEERRLWYVALTRTKSYTFIIANYENPSIFVKEIQDKCLVLNPGYFESESSAEISCPRCKSGHLVQRTNESDHTQFFGCSNYPFCNYSIDDKRAVFRNKRCPKCGDFMIYRKGRFGVFYGCHSHPRCNYTEEYVPSKKTN